MFIKEPSCALQCTVEREKYHHPTVVHTAHINTLDADCQSATDKLLYLRIVLTVSVNAYGNRDVKIIFFVGLLGLVVEEVYLSCKVEDGISWRSEGAMNWIKSSFPHIKLARLWLNPVILQLNLGILLQCHIAV